MIFYVLRTWNQHESDFCFAFNWFHFNSRSNDEVWTFSFVDCTNINASEHMTHVNSWSKSKRINLNKLVNSLSFWIRDVIEIEFTVSRRGIEEKNYDSELLIKLKLVSLTFDRHFGVYRPKISIDHAHFYWLQIVNGEQEIHFDFDLMKFNYSDR